MTEQQRKKTSRPLRPASVIALSFLFVIIAGACLFTLPFMTRDGKGLDFFTGLFTAVSGVCVTGLTLIDPAVTLTRYGQVLLLTLIEIGGIGMVTFVSFFLFTFKKRSGLRSMVLASEYTNVSAFSQTKPLVRVIFFTALVCQLAGAGLLCLRFVPQMGAKGVWTAVFTAVSAYCNAGFDLFGVQKEFGSLTGFNSDPFVMLVISSLIITGGLGFYVFYDLINYRKSRKLSLHSRVVLVFTAALLLFGFAFILLFEYSNPKTLGQLPFSQKLTAAFFQSVTSRTAGFASVDIGGLHDVTKVFMMALMFIGAGSGSTGGGVKITTFAVLIMTAASVIKNREDTVVFRRRIDRKTVSKSLAVSLLGIAAVFAVSCVILVDLPRADGISVFFEAVSAFATTGVSSGVTAQCGRAGLCALIAAMFIGRTGPISFIVAMNIRDGRRKGEVLPEASVMVG